tara:strand:+ start:252 stop:1652 length:1401 start_codon:yes stop_codon:yes gene_type:complete
MADGGIADFTKQVTQTNAALKGKFNKSLTATYAKVTILSKAFGPFLDVWMKLKPAISAVLSPLKLFTKPFTVLDKTSKSVRLSFLGIITVLMTFVAFLALLAGGLGKGNEASEGVVASIGRLRDKLVETWEKIGEFDLQPVFDLASGVIDTWVSLAEELFGEVVDIIIHVLDNYDKIPQALEDVGFLDTLRGAWQNLKDGLDPLIQGVTDMLDAMGYSGMDLSETIIAMAEDIWNALDDWGIIEIFNSIIDLTSEFIEMIMTLVGTVLTEIAKLTGTEEFDIFAGMVESLLTTITGTIDQMLDLFGSLFESISNLLQGEEDPFQPLMDSAQGLYDFVTGKFDDLLEWLGGIDIMGALGDAGEWIMDMGGAALGALMPQGATGGIMKGPKSGFPAILHGTEAVVPLPDGNSIPVAIEGELGGGGGGTFNINVSGANGDPEKIAKAVGKEVQRVFKSRSRSGGYGRGI